LEWRQDQHLAHSGPDVVWVAVEVVSGDESNKCVPGLSIVFVLFEPETTKISNVLSFLNNQVLHGEKVPLWIIQFNKTSCFDVPQHESLHPFTILEHFGVVDDICVVHFKSLVTFL